MSGEPDPKPGIRRVVKDPAAMKRALLAHPACVACGEPGANSHHVLERDDGGDDVLENLITLCGSGTMRCHGAYHGNPYELRVPDPFLVPGDAPRMTTGRRDRSWVAHRIGAHLLAERHDVIRYVVSKLGPIRGPSYLVRYGLLPEDLAEILTGDIVAT